MDYITPISALLKSIIDRVWPDKSEQEKLELELAMKEATGEIELLGKQIEVNIEEAKHSSVFIAGWRPCLGWICAIAFLYHTVLLPLLLFITGLFGVIIPVPAFDMSSLLYVLGGILGLGGFRTYEKIKGVDRKTIK